MVMERLAEAGIRLSLEAEGAILAIEEERRSSVVDKLIEKKKPFFNKEDVDELLNPPKVEIIRSDFQPLAKEYQGDIKIDHARDITGKSRTKGEVEDFISYFRSRYEKISRMLKGPSKFATVNLADIKKSLNDRARIIVSVMEKRETQKGNVLLEVEDLTGQFKVIIPSGSTSSNDKEKLLSKSKFILADDVIAITGKVLEPYMIAEDVEWPDLPVMREKKFCENDLAVAYISDIHFGSRYYLDRYLNAFADWLHGKGEARELASKVKYIVVAGDIVDGIGVYPNQEKELVVTDIYKQYAMFDDFVEKIPDYIEIIVAPGNHDAVRRGEPMPAIGKDMIGSDVTLVGNPSTLSINGLKHIIYHGTSMDSLIAALPNASYGHPEKVMTEYLKRRHLSPIYGGNQIVPEKVDYMVLEDPPDILHCGHVHKNGYTMYRGTIVINSGTFQDRTEYQIKQGHIPTPAVVPVYELKTGRLKTLDFKES